MKKETPRLPTDCLLSTHTTLIPPSAASLLNNVKKNWLKIEDKA